MRKEDEHTLLLLAGIYILGKYSWDVAPALQRGGASVYDWLHDDAGHKSDLPGHQLTKQAVLQIATNAKFPNPKVATAIAFAESGGVPNALAASSREYSVGLWQINLMKHPYTRENMADPVKNAAAAYQISKGGTDWRPWTSYVNGKYKQFLTGILA
jgi:lysozyme-like protein